MKRQWKRAAGLAATLLAAAALAACGNLSQVTDEGTTDNPVWPDPADARGEGTFPLPKLAEIRDIGPGMTKDQFYKLLGIPHFGEGLAGVREWDYLFHFRTADGILSCQYKILYDKTMHAQSFFWKPESCADLLDQAEAPAPAAQTLSLDGDVLFAFDSAVLTAAGQDEVRRVAGVINDAGAASVVVVGHTDRLGSADYNQRLSERRAQAVRTALIGAGVAASAISAHGAGETQPLVQCEAAPRAELIDCLAPNRRVELTVSGGR